MKGKIHGRVVDYHRIADIDDWRKIRAAGVLSVPGAGPGYLDKLRIWLAHRDVNLLGDNPPEYWLHLMSARSGQDIDADSVAGCPFTVVVDTNETFPFMFLNIRDNSGNRIIVPTETRPLYLRGFADYTIDGLEEEIQIERKSKEDLVSTLSGRRESFEEEIMRIDGMCGFAAIVCECSWLDILEDRHIHGAGGLSVVRTFQSWAIKYPRVHWIMCGGRDQAESMTYWLMHNFWWQHHRDGTKSDLLKTDKKVFGTV